MIPQGDVPLVVLRPCMLLAGAITVPAATALVVSSPPGRFTALGGFIIAGGLYCLSVWWRTRPRPADARAARLVAAGAVLGLASIALIEGGLVLFLGRYPDDPLSAFVPSIAVGGAGVLCLPARIVVGVRSRLARKAPPTAAISDRMPRDGRR